VKPSTVRLIAIIVGVLIVGVAAASKLGGGGSDSASTTGTTATTAATTVPAGSIGVTFAYSPEKEALVSGAIDRFNAQHHEVNGKRVVARGVNVASGAAYDALRLTARRLGSGASPSSLPSDALTPTLWSPASSLWGRLLTQTADVTWVPQRNPSFVRTPLVIAIWEPEARALGWPSKPLGWADILAEAQNPKGFARFGHPEWGAFKLGHTNPDFSTAGLSAVAAEYYAATGKTEGLTAADVTDPAVRRKIRAIESSIVHYGDTTLFFEQQLAAHGPGFASAVALEEATLIDYNTKQRQGGPRLVAIYPKEGTFFSDNPLIVLDAPWVSADQKAAAAQLVDYLRSAEVQRGVTKLGFRPSDPAGPFGGTLTKANGVDTRQPTRLLSLPEPALLARIKALWQQDRKPADIAIVLDTSGSMQDEDKLEHAKAGLHQFIAALGAHDRAALVTFADSPHLVEPLAPLAKGQRARLQHDVGGLFASGGTSVFDATLAGVNLLERSGDPQHIRAAVVLTDGQDNKSSASAGQVVQRVGGGSEGNGIRVFTIAYGSDADESPLQQIAAAAGGREYAGDTQTISAVYTSISSFF
jgi:Ca-activated chloride channel family protein